MMTETPNKYSVMELAEAVGVPRTTINDWLSRYERFIDFRPQGKRKVYTAATLAVLQEIGELRNRGLSSFDIEEELGKRHPMRGEVAESGAGGGAGEADGGADGAMPLVLRQQVSEMADQLRQSLLDIQRRLEDLDARQERTAARAGRWTALAVLLAVLLVLAGIAGAVKLQRAVEVNRRLAAERQQAHQALQQAEEELGKQIDRESRLANDLNATRLDMASQETEFRERLEVLRRDADTAREAALAEQRDEFAKARLELLRQVEAARDNEERLAPLLRQIQEQVEAQNEALRQLGEAIPPPPAVVPEPAGGSPSPEQP
jgi:DNA-binding transcriptional MerR regulator